MGNVCGKSDPDPFAGQGRTLGSAPTPGQPARAAVPASASAPKRVGGPPRTLGGSGEAAGSEGPDEARRKAAAAAEVRIPFCRVLGCYGDGAVGS